jgi:hypothetical protein
MRQNFSKFFTKQKLIAIAIVSIIFAVAIIFWLRRAQREHVLEQASFQITCTLWRYDIDAQLAALRVKYITDRDAYLLILHRRLANTIQRHFNDCRSTVPPLRPRELRRRLERLAIHLSQKNDLALRDINSFQELFQHYP